MPPRFNQSLATYNTNANKVEGSRFRFGGRTSNAFSNKVMFSGYAAYGLTDERFKYGGDMLYIFSKSPRSYLNVSYKHDVEQLGQNQDAYLSGNIFSSLLIRNQQYKLSMVDEYKVEIMKEWFAGFSNTIGVRHRTLFSGDSVPFIPDGKDISIDHIRTFEVNLKTHFAYNEKFIMGEFERVSLGSKYPILDVDFTAGMKWDPVASEYEYYKLHASLAHDFNISPFGRMNLTLSGGKIWGDLPYPLLRLHAGNETYGFDDNAFNMMNYYEFVSDEYVSLFAEHHFEGFFLNKLPLIRKLKWREVIYGKAVIGRLDQQRTLDLMSFPSNLNQLSQPYYEAGVGIENIFKVFRLDAMWRLSYLNNYNIQKFGPRLKIQIVF